MFDNSNKHVCVIARDVCPETDDRTKPKYCPFWKVGIPDIQTDGSGRLISNQLYTGCSVYKILPYIVAGIAEADHAHKAANETRDKVSDVMSPVNRLNECFNGLVQLASVSLVSSNKRITESSINVKELPE